MELIALLNAIMTELIKSLFYEVSPEKSRPDGKPKAWVIRLIEFLLDQGLWTFCICIVIVFAIRQRFFPFTLEKASSLGLLRILVNEISSPLLIFMRVCRELVGIPFLFLCP